MKLLLKIFVFLLLSGAVAFAQEEFYTVSGKVISAKTGKTPIIIMARPITIVSDYWHTEATGWIDSVGNFKIKKIRPGKLKVSFRLLGYRATDTTFEVENQNLTDILIPFNFSCIRFSRDKALKDLDSGKITFLKQNGYEGRVYEGDEAFKKKYNATFHDFGCEMMEYIECVHDYNFVMFRYLDEKFGKRWRAEIRPDIIGLREYIAEN